MDEDGIVKCSRKVMIQPDTTLKAISENQYDVVVLPGMACVSSADSPPFPSSTAA